MRWILITFIFSLTIPCIAQEAVIRGNVYEKATGQPIMFGSVYIEGKNIGTTTNDDGFFVFPELSPGTYKVVASYIGFDTVSTTVNLSQGEIEYIQLNMETGGVELATVDVSAERESARKEVQISTQRVSQQDITSLPSTGGEADIAQYLPVLPGIVFTGDQGGRLYIRGGAPVQNKILLDGMTIYNPFHSIGLFSVFETELIRSVEVQSAGFSAEHGGRVSAIVDIDTRSGNNKRLSGTVGVSPFQAKAIIEGPIIPAKGNDNSSLTFMLAGKQSLINESDRYLYEYASDSSGLPFEYRDLYGKVTFSTNNGSQFDIFGFNFADDVIYPGIAELGWDATGAGGSFRVIPSNSNFVLDGLVAGSNYMISLEEFDNNPRSSEINDFTAQLEFTYFGGNNEIKYGFNINSISTDFRFTNFANINFVQEDNNTELNGYFKYKQEWGDLILEPSFRVQYYSSINTVSPEPRLRAKYNVTRDLRLKGAVGYYTQNLLSTVNDRDIVNLFVGFLIGPEETLFDPETGLRVDNRLQTAWHYVGGVEYDINREIRLNIETYLKDFGQMVNINRNKIEAGAPNYIVETGEAYGIDFNAEYKKGSIDLWATYSLGYVNRFNGEQRYPTNFDRRHNINLLATYQFGNNNSWEASARWNFGTGFPFTLTEGFYGRYDFDEGVNEDIVQSNPDIGIIYDDKINGGRLPSYHRLDMSLKKKWKFGKYVNLEALLSVTNAYDRENIFYFDRVEYKRVNQLPILPAAGLVFRF